MSNDGNRILLVNKLRGKLMKAFNEMGRFSVERVQAELSIPSPPPSRPGEVPHEDTSELHDSQYYEVKVKGMYGVDLRIGNHADHAEYLEFGTEKMAPRPFLRPEIARLKTEVPQLIKKNLTGSGTGGGQP